MDFEAQLIQSQNWSELRRHYARTTGYSWEQAWLHLHQMEDRGTAIEHFRAALRDPRFEEASMIMLWRLGQKPSLRPASIPPSLRLYEAYQEGELRPFLSFLMSREAEPATRATIFRQVLLSKRAIQKEDLDFVSLKALDPISAYFVGQIFSQRLKQPQVARPLFESFVTDVWTQRVLKESRRCLVDSDMQRRLRHAYAQKDGQSLKRLYRAMEAKLKKQEIPPIWQKALTEALKREQKDLTQNLVGYAFWRGIEWSPSALFEMRSIAFPEPLKPPPFVEAWERFFNSTEKKLAPPIELEPDRLSLWQICVELNPARLSDALLRFPTEERFLFLWSLRSRSLESGVDSLWPAGEVESEVVRKNLERAFERSTNKLIWFDRLRQCGCSQSFYEFAISQIEVPIPSILEDLKAGRLKPSAEVRAHLKSQLTLTSAKGSESSQLSSEQILDSFSYLTPAEMQEVLLSRYVMLEIPSEILNLEYLDLFWGAMDRVSVSVQERWTRSAVDFITTRVDSQNLQEREWRWIQRLWQFDQKALEDFSPSYQDSENFPWSAYLEAAVQHSMDVLVSACIPQIPDERQRAHWIERLIDRLPMTNLKKWASNFQDDNLRLDLQIEILRREAEPLPLIKALVEKLEACSVLNEKPSLIREIITKFFELREEEQLHHFDLLQRLLEEMQSLGACDASFMAKLIEAADALGDWGKSWQWNLQAWFLATDKEKNEILDQFLDSAFRARAIEEAQRILVDFVFQSARPNDLNRNILDRLLGESSAFRIKHLRRELILRSGCLYPLHQKILEYRAQFDYRAYLLWRAFYGDQLDSVCEPPVMKKRKFYRFWGLIQANTQPEMVSAFTRYLDPLSGPPQTTEGHAALGSAQKLLNQWQKSFRVKSKVKVFLSSNLQTPLRFHLESQAISAHPLFFNEIDEKIWAAIVTGYLQILADRERGLYSEPALMERFFQGCLLAGSPIEKVIKLCTWLAIHEGIVGKNILRAEPQELVSSIGFLNQLLIFYLGEDFERKQSEDGIPLC
ncbi:MAG: hypothetical protein EA369_01370 [Bradymonadales bacterium]|nr:MAG: hypothetical protein EA369_01370 [Bradymonadales bacterium]